MSIFKFVLALRSLGLLFSEIGELLKRLSEIRQTPNLGGSQPRESDQEDMSQDSEISNGESDEEPEGVEAVRESDQGDLFETTPERRSPPHP